MKRILKVGDKVYAQSIQHFSPRYFQGFPQREQFLLQHLDGKCRVEFLRHKILNNISDVSIEQEKLNQHLQKHQYDYILIDNPLSALLINPTIKIPIVFDCIDWYEEMYLTEFGADERYFLLKKGFESIIKIATKVITQSPTMLEALKREGLRTNKTVIIPNGYDENIFYKYSDEKIKLLKLKYAKKYNISFEQKQILVYTGKLSKWYEDIRLIISSIDENQLLFIVGDGPLLASLPDLPQVIKTGAVPLLEVPNYTNIADVLVFPVSVDCSPIAVSEYLAVGKPIVMGKGRIGWLLKDGINGSLVDKNIDSWRNGIAMAYENRESMGKNNVQLSRDLTWEKASSTLTSFLEAE